MCSLVALVVAPIASAQQPTTPLPHTIALASAQSHADLLASATATFAVTVKNTGALAKTVSLGGVSTNPPGWLYDFTPQQMTIEPGTWNNTTLTVTAPANANPGNVTLGFGSTEPTSPINSTPQADSDVLPFTFTILPPPPAPEKPQPKIAVDVAASSGADGSTVDGLVTLINSDSIPYDAVLSVAGPFAWHPALDLTSIKLYPGTPARVAVHAIVPLDASNGTTQAFTIRASVGDASFVKTWVVTAIAAPPAKSTAAPSSGGSGTSSTTTSTGTGPSTTSGGSGASTLDAPTFILVATPVPAQKDAPAGESIQAQVLLENRGTSTLHLKLVPRAGDGWPVRLSANEFDLAAGTIRYIDLEIDVPRDAVPGGTGTADVSITGDAGLLKHATFTLFTVAGKPRQDLATTALVAPNEPAGGLGLSPATATVVVGLSAVGVGALALARRPLREKLIWGGVGLYTRLLRPDVLGHEERDKLYKLVETQPGIHFHALQRELNWNTGTLTYHLRVLEKHGFVVDRRDGPLRRFYISGAAPRKELFNTDQPHGLRADVLEAIRNRHGISQSDLALALGANKQTVNYHVKALEKQGVIRIEKRGRETFLHMVGAAPAGAAAPHDEARA